MLDKILCITGPTASGKSELAMHLCRTKKQKNFEIISMDSAQIYKGVDIASAKPSKIDRQEKIYAARATAADAGPWRGGGTGTRVVVI